MLIVVFSVTARALPSGGYVPLDAGPGQWLRFAILPAVALSIDAAGSLARQLRTSLVGALRENYVTGAEMRGFSRRRVLFGHVLRNAVGPALAVLGMAVPTIIGGAVITEKIFNLPGIAQLALQSAPSRATSRSSSAPCWSPSWSCSSRAWSSTPCRPPSTRSPAARGQPGGAR